MRVLYVSLVLLLSLPVFIVGAEVTVMEQIVAKVNGEIITTVQLKEDLAALELVLKQAVQEKALSAAEYQKAFDEGKTQLLADRIDSMLMMQRAKELNFEKQVEGDLTKEIAGYQRRANIADQEEFQKFVEQATGRPYEDFRASIRERLLADMVKRDEIYRKIDVSQIEVRAYYDAHMAEFQRQEALFLREILVSTRGKTGKDLEDAEAKIKDLADRAKRGEAFVKMAENNSDAPTKADGGLLQFAFTKDLLDPRLASLWDEPAGYVTDPIRFDEGWQIYKVEAHQRGGQATFADAEAEIQNRLFAERAQPAIRAYLIDLRGKAFLQIKDGYVDVSANPSKDTAWVGMKGLKPKTVAAKDVLANPSMKRLLGMFPIPGTQKTGASSSR